MKIDEYFEFYFYLSEKPDKQGEYILYGLEGKYDISGKENEIVILSEENEFGKNMINVFKNKDKKLINISISIIKSSSQLIEDSILEIEFIFDCDITDNDRIYTLKLDTRDYTNSSIVKRLFKLLQLFPPKPDMFFTLNASKIH